MNNGWIKLHRKLQEKGYYRKPNYVFLWIHLLLSANHKSREFMWNGQILIVKEGQLITGRKQLALETGIKESTIERVLTMLESEHQIEQQKTTKYRLITILNWKEHQKENNETDGKRTTNGQQADTNKNDKNERMKEDTSKAVALQGTQWNELIDSFKEVNPSFSEFYSNRTERSALEKMVTMWGYEKTLHTIQGLSQIINQPYAPKITKPTELKRDIGKLVAFYNQEKLKITSKKKFIV